MDSTDLFFLVNLSHHSRSGDRPHGADNGIFRCPGKLHPPPAASPVDATGLAVCFGIRRRGLSTRISSISACLSRTMVFIYYTVTGLILYFVSDWILDRIEFAMGRRLEYRTLVFFAIILVLAVGSFRVIDWIVSGPR